MSKTQRIKGVLAPVVTPFDRDLNPDTARFIAHCQWLISQGSGASLAGLSRAAFLDALSAAGVSPFRETLWEVRCESADGADRWDTAGGHWSFAAYDRALEHA